MDLQDIEDAKENGRRKIFRVRFPTIYGSHSKGFIVRTLLRGEIFSAFSKVGYPEREIPKDKVHARCRVENELFPICVLSVPDKFTLFRAHAFIVTTIVNESLRRSGFIDGSEEQMNVLKYGLRYANSVEGRTDAIILRTFPSIRPYDLSQMSYEEWSMCSMQAILLSKSVDGKDISEFLTPDPNVLRAFDPPAEMEEPEFIAKDVPAAPRFVTAPPPRKKSETDKSELIRKVGAAPNISAQAIGLNPNGNSDISVERGETRMFIAGERYDVDKLKSKIRKDSSG